MKDFNTLGDLLLRKYTVDFISKMQNLPPPIIKALRRQDRLFDKRSRTFLVEGTIFKKHMFSRWSIVEGVSGTYPSVIGHRCFTLWGLPVLKYPHFSTLHPDYDEVCRGCEKPVPSDIVGLWKMHNFEEYQSIKIKGPIPPRNKMVK